MANSMDDFQLLSTTLRLLIDAAPYFLMCLLFIALYVLMPNTHVKVKNAIVPGILSGIAMQVVQFVYIHSQMWVTGYNAIYGSFAALPLFMLWVQISWWEMSVAISSSFAMAKAVILWSPVIMATSMPA